MPIIKTHLIDFDHAIGHDTRTWHLYMIPVHDTYINVYHDAGYEEQRMAGWPSAAQHFVTFCAIHSPYYL